jgi:hypothetical protein
MQSTKKKHSCRVPSWEHITGDSLCYQAENQDTIVMMTILLLHNYCTNIQPSTTKTYIFLKKKITPQKLHSCSTAAASLYRTRISFDCVLWRWSSFYNHANLNENPHSVVIAQWHWVVTSENLTKCLCRCCRYQILISETSQNPTKCRRLLHCLGTKIFIVT